MIDQSAADREGNNSKGLKHFCLKIAQAKAKIWPWLSYMCQLRSTAGLTSVLEQVLVLRKKRAETNMLWPVVDHSF